MPNIVFFFKRNCVKKNVAGNLIKFKLVFEHTVIIVVKQRTTISIIIINIIKEWLANCSMNLSITMLSTIAISFCVKTFYY